MYPIKSKCQINKNEGNCELTLSPGGPLGPGGPSSPCRENALVNMAVFWINNTTSTSSVYFWVRLITSPWVQACQENHLLHARPWAPLETQDYNLDVILAKLVPAKSIFQAYHQPRGTNEPTVYDQNIFFKVCLWFLCNFSFMRKQSSDEQPGARLQSCPTATTHTTLHRVSLDVKSLPIKCTKALRFAATVKREE